MDWRHSLDPKIDWYFPTISPINLRSWYEKLSSYPSFEHSWDTFKDTYSTAQMVIETHYGILRFDNLQPGSHVQVHGFFWSPRIFKKVEIFTEISDYLFSLFGFSYILVVTPDTASGLAKLLTRIGFTRARHFDNEFYWELRRHHEPTR